MVVHIARLHNLIVVDSQIDPFRFSSIVAQEYSFTLSFDDPGRVIT